MPSELTASSLGSRAAQSLSTNQAPRVRGVTSRGVYLQTSPQAVIFLTRDPTHSPFTVNVAGLPGEFPRLAPGDPVSIQDHAILLPSEALSISTQGVVIWNTPPSPETRLAGPAQQAALARLARAALEAKGWVGLGSLLAGLLALEIPLPPEEDPLGLKIAVAGALQALTARDDQALMGALLRGMGRGPGLTPSGDDLSVGVLLALRRGSPNLLASDQVDRLAEGLTATAYQKTTTYSANLIDAAGHGEADERLLAACDCVFSGRPDPEQAARAVVHWGSSSGIDTLTGICLVCLAAQAANPTQP